MFSRDPRRERRIIRPRRRPERVAVEGLETRQLMTYSPFGFSLPQLSVTGYSASQAAYGGPLTVDVTVENQGASSLIEPTNLAPGAISTADSPPTTVQVFASTKPNATAGLVLVDTIVIPSIRQNSDYEVISTFALPARPPGFPANGGKIYLTLVVNNNQAILETSTVNNIYRVPRPVTITRALPDLHVVALDIPATLQPGDVISPTIRVTNTGSGTAGPVLVQLVASLDKNFGPGDAVVGQYVIPSLPGISGVPSKVSFAGDANVLPTPNENTTTLPPLKLPSTPGFYYLGVVIDPFHTFDQATPASPALQDVVPVGPADPFLPPGRLLSQTNGAIPIFPQLPSAIINPVAVVPVVVIPPLFPNPVTNPGPPILRAASIKVLPGHGHPTRVVSDHAKAAKDHGKPSHR